METLRPRYLKVVFLLLLTTGLSVFYLYPSKTPPKVKYAEKLPMTLLDWHGSDTPVDEETKAILETDDVLMREYQRGTESPILLSVVFAEENRKVAHPPEVCLTGSGFEVKEKSTYILTDDFRVIRLITYYGPVQEVYYYWFKSGDFFTESYIRQQLNIAWNHLLRRPASASLIRISTRIQGDQINAAEARLQEFSLALLPYVKQTLP